MHAEADAIGRTLSFLRGSVAIVGVLPRAFAHSLAGLMLYRPMYSPTAGRGTPYYNSYSALPRFG